MNVRYFRHQFTIAKYILFPPKVTSLFDLFCHYSISLHSCLCSGWNKKKSTFVSPGHSLVKHLYAMEIKTIMCENKYTYFTWNGYYVPIFSAYLLINPFFSLCIHYRKSSSKYQDQPIICWTWKPNYIGQSAAKVTRTKTRR